MHTASCNAVRQLSTSKRVTAYQIVVGGETAPQTAVCQVLGTITGQYPILQYRYRSNPSTQIFVILHALTHQRTLIARKKVGHPDLLSSSFWRSQKYLCAVSLQFASWVHLTWMQSNLGFDLLFRSHGVIMYESNSGTTREGQVVTAVHRHFESCTY